MASIYKRNRDKLKKRSVWFIDYTDENGARRTLKGFTDRGESERLAAKLEHEVMLRKRGLIDPEQVRLAERRKAPLESHLQAFKKSLLHTSPKHVDLVTGRIRRVLAGLGWSKVSDMSVDAAEEFLRALAAKHDLGHRTYNHYVQALDEFCRWLVQTKRVASHPLACMARLNTHVDVRHRRRALSGDEIGLLIQTARVSQQSIQQFDGETRARIYTLAYMTGLRRNELASLTPESFSLDTDQPTVTVEAKNSKHRRRDTLPLHPELVAMLRIWLPEYPDGEPLFPKLGKRRTWLMVQKDLGAAGIDYRTSEGVADFHAAGRHTYITELLRSGATLPEARQLARHSDVNMTMRYTHIGLEDQARAITHLPVPRTGRHPARDKASAAIDQPHSDSASRVSGCHNGADGDTECELSKNDATPAGGGGCHQISPSGGDCQKWRRRESNPRPVNSEMRPLRA